MLRRLMIFLGLAAFLGTLYVGFSGFLKTQQLKTQKDLKKAIDDTKERTTKIKLNL